MFKNLILLYRSIKEVAFTKLALSIVLSFILSGCHRPDPCIDADDFGHKKVHVSSRYDTSDIHGPNTAQITPWIDSGVKLSGKPLAIMVKNWHYGEDSNTSHQLSAWCPWYGDDGNKNSLPTICERLPSCIFMNDQMCSNTRDAPIINAPCVMKRGVGLYGLVSKPYYNPNTLLSTMTRPDGFTFHVGQPSTTYQMYDVSGAGRVRPAGGVVFNYDAQGGLNSNRLDYVNGKLFFKILDNYYPDNGGQYRVVIKSGTIDPAGDMISYVTNIVKQRLFGNNDPSAPSLERYGVVRGIYLNVITNNSFVHAIRGLLILYVILMGLGFVAGLIELTKSELLKRVVKIIIITILINPTFSWDFFNQYIFIWFYEGTEFIVGILRQAAASGPGDVSIITFLTSEEIFIKLSALLFSTKTGFIYIFVYLIMLVFVIFAVFDAAVLYMTSMVMMGLLICLAPIFIGLSLFESTKSFFDNWLKQLTGYAVQGIIVTAGVLFMSMIIRNQIYNTLGYRVCSTDFIALGDPVPPLFSWYMPQIASDANKPALALIPIPKDHFQTPHDQAIGFAFDNKPTGDFCAAYECFGMRYPDLPFLDPRNPAEMRQMNLLRSSDIIDWGGLGIICICVYLMSHFNTTTVTIAKFLSGTMMNSGSNSKAAGAISGGAYQATVHNKYVGQAAAYLDKKSGFKESRARVHDFWAQNKHLLDKKYQDWQENDKRKDALTSGALKSVLGKVESKTGLTQSSALEFKSNMKNGGYGEGLSDALRQHANIQNEKLLEKHSAKLLSELSKGKVDDFHKEAAKVLFDGKKYSELSANEKAMLNGLMSDSSVKAMLDAKRKQELFQQAYADTHLEESQKGMGPLAKRSGFLAGWQDINNELKADAEKAAMKQKLKDEKWESAGGELKRLLSGGLFGDERNQVMHDDAGLRTADEKLADRERELQAIRDKKLLDRATLEAGADIGRPDYLARLRANGQHELADKYDALVERNVKNDIYKALRNEHDHEGPAFYGNTHIAGMEDKDMRAMMDRIHQRGQEHMEKDLYSKMSFMYKDEGSRSEFEKRMSYMEDAVSSEIDRINNMRVQNGMEEYHPQVVKRAGGFGSSEGSGSSSGDGPTPPDDSSSGRGVRR